MPGSLPPSMWPETADRRLKAAVQRPSGTKTPPGPLDGLYGDPTSDVSVRNRAGFDHVDQGEAPGNAGPQAGIASMRADAAARAQARA